MRFLHLGDLHIGKTLGDFDLYEDQRYILNQILELIPEKKIDAVLLAGDIYDKAVPTEAAVSVLDYFIRRLAALQVKVFLISGNHDSDERLNFGSEMFEQSGIYIASKFEGKLAKYTAEDEHGRLNIYLLPFVKASQVRHFFPEEKIENYEDAVRTVIEHSDFDKKERNILVAHQFVAGREQTVLSGSEGMAVQSVGTVEQIGYRIFEDFDYVALGHIHSPQRVGPEHIRYSGSLLKYSLKEVNNEKSAPIVTVGEKGSVDIELVPLTPMRDVRHVRGKLDQLLDPKRIKDPGDFIYVTLTNEDMVDDAMAIFQQYYPNTVKLDYDNSHTREIEHMDISAIAQNQTFSELISDFYEMMYAAKISEEELEIMKEVAREAGVIHEAG